MKLARALLWIAPAVSAVAQAQQPGVTPQPGAPEEVFEKVDPYTRGAKADLARAGYESLGPFHWADGIETKDIEETLGIRILWVETAHLKIGSTLPSYELPPDDREREKLKEELGRLGKRLPRVRQVTKIDPWLRLHLYAQRLEEQYAGFEARFGLKDADFEPQSGAAEAARPDLGPGRYLGQPLKFTVLLTHKIAPLARFCKRWIGNEEQGYYQALLPGGSWFAGASSEPLKNIGAEFDSVLHATIVHALVENLCDGFRGTGRMQPLWWRHGLALCCSRAVEDRWSIHVPRIDTGSEADAGRWDIRLRALVENRFVPTWNEMLAWPQDEKLEAPQHMAAWSRVSWLLGLEKADLHAFLLDMSQHADDSVASIDPAAHALQTAFGKNPAELDEAWRKWVLKKYPKR
jgi:hypothetical protein